MNRDGLEWWNGDRGPDTRIGVLGRLYSLVEERIPQAAGPARALDLGCGEGMVTGILVSKGYTVTAVDRDRESVSRVRDRFPEVEVVEASLMDLPDLGCFDLTTMIYTAQSMRPETLCKVLSGIRKVTDRLIIEFANSKSLYRWWVNFRGFKVEPPVYPVSPTMVDSLMERAGFSVTYRQGLGLLMPMSLLSGYRLPFVPGWLVSLVNRFEHMAPCRCHLYYVEAQ